jgi:hypothetical protein
MLFPALFRCLSWVSRGTGEAPRGRPQAKPPALRRPFRPRLEQLEDRTLPSNFTASTVSDLIADINAANKAGGSNSITLTAPTSSPYVLTQVDNTMDGPTGLPVISGGTKPDNLTIVGNGDTIERSTASGTPDFRLLDVAIGASLTLENVTLQNGLAFGSGSSAEGGAIFNQGTLVLSGVTLQSNRADGSNGTDGNKAKPGGAGSDSEGGGIWSNGTLTLENATAIKNNESSGGQGGSAGGNSPSNGGGTGGNAYGGGIYIAGGTANLTDVTLAGNAAAGGQGGEGGNGFEVTNGGNGGDAFGGGLFVLGGNVSLSSDIIENNRAGGASPGSAGSILVLAKAAAWTLTAQPRP